MRVDASDVPLSAPGFGRTAGGFLADPLWWLAVAVGLAFATGMLWAFPDALVGSALNGIGAWLSCVVGQPVLEEVAFRGILQGELLHRRWGRRRWFGLSAANLLSSAAFTGMHFVHHPPLWAASVLVPSLLFGWVRERHQGLGAPIGLHVLFNLEFFAAAALAAA